MQTQTEINAGFIDQLNSFLRGELSAVETYRQAIDKITEPRLRVGLEECRRSHQGRVDLLRRRVIELGGTPSTSSGAWGTFAQAVEGGAKVFGEKAAINALESGEDHGLKEYRATYDSLSRDAQQWIKDQLLSAQERTHRTMSDMKHTLTVH